jgi:outer membrane protein
MTKDVKPHHFAVKAASSLRSVPFSIFHFLLPLFLFPLLSSAQNAAPLSLADALAIALDRNHGIQMAKNTTRMAKNRATAGNAGLLPSLGVTSGGQWSQSMSQLEFAAPGVPGIDTSGTASAFNASLNFSYVLFDGLGNIRNFRKLKLQGSISEVQGRIAIENTMIAVAGAYFEALMAAEARSIAEENLKVTLSRLERESTTHNLGIGNRILLLNARLYAATDSVGVAQAAYNERKALRNLKQLMQWEGADPALQDELLPGTLPGYDALRDGALANSAAIILSAHNLETSELDVKLARSTQFPLIVGQAAYGYQRNTSEVSFIQESTSLGPTLGISLSYNLFDGRKKHTQLQNAKIAMETGRIKDTEARQELLRNLDNGYDLYTTNTLRLRLSEQAVETAEAAFARTSELFALGQVTGLEHRDAQLAVMNSKMNARTARIAAKLAELDLLRLSGGLLRED